MVVVLLLKAISTKQTANFAVIHQPSPWGEGGRRIAPLGWGGKFSSHYYNNIKPELFHLITVLRRSVSLRLGHAPALNVHRTFIHYRRAASLPSRGSLEKFLLHFKIYREHCANQYSVWGCDKIVHSAFCRLRAVLLRCSKRKRAVDIVPTNTQSEVVTKLFTVHFADWELYLCTAPIEKCAVGDFSQP